MSDAPLTRATLLLRIRDPKDQHAWKQFVDLYSAVIYGYARRRGLQDADAADLTQDVLRSVAVAASRLNYDPGRGTFRSWLFTVTRNKLLNLYEHRRSRPQASGDSTVRQQLAETADLHTDPDEPWETEWRRQLTARAMQRVEGQVQPETWKAFVMTAVENRSAREAASATGLSPGAIYVAKSRVLARLREEIEKLEADL